MILLIVSPAQATHIAQRVEDPQLLDHVCAQLRCAELFDDDAPRTVLFRDEGDGLRMAAVSYFNEAAAVSAEDRFWARVVAGDTVVKASRKARR